MKFRKKMPKGMLNHRLTIHIARNATSKQFEYVLKYLSIAYQKQETPGTIHPINQLPRSRLNLEKLWNMNEETAWKDIASVQTHPCTFSLPRRRRRRRTRTRGCLLEKNLRLVEMCWNTVARREIYACPSARNVKRTLKSISVENLTNFYLPFLTIHCFS